MDEKLQRTDGNYLFNVDILINARTNPLALQFLLEMLNNNDHITDFNINSGLELGRTIDSLLRSAKLALNQNSAPPISLKLPPKSTKKQLDTPIKNRQKRLHSKRPLRRQLMHTGRFVSIFRIINWYVYERTGTGNKCPCPVVF